MKAGLIVILMASFVGRPVWPAKPSLAQLEKAIRQKGAERVARELSEQQNPDPWDAIDDRVATGDPRWLDVAKQLRPYTDAGVSEALENALAEALPRNAAGVLRILGTDLSKDFTVRRVCSTETFIEVPRPALQRHLRAALAAVKRVTDPKLIDARDACLSKLSDEMQRETRP
jgi:hypothetical protein